MFGPRRPNCSGNRPGRGSFIAVTGTGASGLSTTSASFLVLQIALTTGGLRVWRRRMPNPSEEPSSSPLCKRSMACSTSLPSRSRHEGSAETVHYRLHRYRRQQSRQPHPQQATCRLGAMVQAERFPRRSFIRASVRACSRSQPAMKSMTANRRALYIITAGPPVSAGNPELVEAKVRRHRSPGAITSTRGVLRRGSPYRCVASCSPFPAGSGCEAKTSRPLSPDTGA